MAPVEACGRLQNGRSVAAPSASELQNDSCSGRRTFDRGPSHPRQISQCLICAGEVHCLARQFRNNADERDQRRNCGRRPGARAGLSYIVEVVERREPIRPKLAEADLLATRAMAPGAMKSLLPSHDHEQLENGAPGRIKLGTLMSLFVLYNLLISFWRRDGLIDKVDDNMDVRVRPACLLNEILLVIYTESIQGNNRTRE